VTNRRPLWSQFWIAAHLAIFAVAGYALSLTRSELARALLSLISGTSLFVLSGLVQQASDYQLARRAWLNDLLGNLASALLGTPLSAYRALRFKHRQATNRDDDPLSTLNSRWMILFGMPTAIALFHGYAWRHFRGRALGRYLIEMCGMFVLVGVIFLLPRAVREWSVAGPLVVMDILLNVQIVTGRWDLTAGTNQWLTSRGAADGSRA
jgi:fatty acid desaturase